MGFSMLFMSSIHSKDYRELIVRLKEARKTAGFTQLEVAERLKKPQSFISKIESGQRRIDVLELKEFAGLYGIDVSQLMGSK